MATGSCTHNPERRKTLTTLIKTYRKVPSIHNVVSTGTNIAKKYSFPCAQWAVLGSHHAYDKMYSNQVVSYGKCLSARRISFTRQ